MSWTKFLTDKTVQNHTTSRQEIDDLRGVVKRDLADAEIDALSDDRRFATAYNAVLQLSKIAIACAGYRISNGSGHYLKTFEVVKTALDSPEADALAIYFDTCRRKRNRIDYDSAFMASESEANELVEKAKEFQKLVENWIAREHPTYSL